VENSDAGLVNVTPIVVDITVKRMVPFSVNWLEESSPVGELQGGSVELNHPVVVDTTADSNDEEPLMELDIGRMVPDSSSVKDLVEDLVEGLVDSLEAVDVTVNSLDDSLPVEVLEADNVELNHPVVVVTAEDLDVEVLVAELDIGRTVPDSSSVEDLVDSLEATEEVLKVDVASDEENE
jgi:hypothetical protein